MATVEIEHVTKVYPNGSEAVKDLSLDVADGEFMVLVGPSGCGKTTTLRMVAGLEDISEGTVKVGERVVNDLSPRDRDMAMVFQNYALYPHMTVAENIGFALKLRKLGKDQIRAKVDEAARILGLEEHLKRKPGQLSGGQRQRVAMGRAIVREPSVFLMDEPLSNLDAKLRVQMRAEISRIQRRLGVATLYVTHDQIEAMTMGDRVAVLSDGTLQQCDAPQTLYDAPANLFVAAFIGSPAMNLYRATLSPDGGEVRLGEQVLELATHTREEQALAAFRGKELVVGIRPEDLADAALLDGQESGGRLPDGHGEEQFGEGEQRLEDNGGRHLVGTVELVEALGSEKLVHFRLEAEHVRGLQTMMAAKGEAEGLEAGEIASATSVNGVARVDPTSRLGSGEEARFAVAVERLHVFDPDGGAALAGPVREATPVR
ncbi:MAG: sn-glycerol-3-phosphate ABC transporter ATP-binding protein UgpC [Solirubrobacteraceae bacterium]